MKEWWKEHAEYRKHFSAWDDFKFTGLSFALPVLAVASIGLLLWGLISLIG